MSDQHPYPSKPQEDRGSAEPDLTVDLSLDEETENVDLQALADEVAEQADESFTEDASALITRELELSLEEAQERILLLEQQEKEHLDKHHRLLADFANFRNRTAKEIQLAVDLAEKKLLLEILPVIDSFERCLDADYQNISDFRDGIGLIHKQCLDALKRSGVESLNVNVGDLFSAQIAEALTTSADPTIPDGAVSAIYERGYKLRDHLIRPARVVVNHLPHNEDARHPLEP